MPGQLREQTIRDAYAAFNAGNVQAVLDLLDDDVARGRESGIAIDETVYHLWHIDGERATRFEAHVDREQALTALRAN